MARAYSQDLRDRMIDAALGGIPARRAAAQFEIGVATAIVWASLISSSRRNAPTTSPPQVMIRIKLKTPRAANPGDNASTISRCRLIRVRLLQTRNCQLEDAA